MSGSMTHSIFDFSKEMTTFAMVVETPPLYKDLETWDESPGSLFCAVFVCILSETTRRKCDPILYLIDTKKNGVHPCNPFHNSNLIFDLSFPPGAWRPHSLLSDRGVRFIIGRISAIDK